jgi:hypothetical protein
MMPFLATITTFYHRQLAKMFSCFDLNNKLKPQIRYVYYELKCCMEARFSKTRRKEGVRNRLLAPVE